MARQAPPDHRDPDAFAGLTRRRQRRGLPVSRGATTQEIGDSLIAQGFTAEPDPDDPEHSTIFRPPPGENPLGR